jgi:hypothetical protein
MSFRCAILLTNLSWAQPFLNSLQNIKPQKLPLSTKDYIEYFGLYNNMKILVTKRPRIGNTDLYTKAILNIINFS